MRFSDGAASDHPPQPLTITDTPAAPVFLDVLRAHGTVTFVLTDKASLNGRYGLVDLDHAIVYLDMANSPGEMRATISHELMHLACPTCTEDEVEDMTAELLVPLPDALAAHAQNTIEETAERLQVDARLVRARIRSRLCSADTTELTIVEAG